MTDSTARSMPSPPWPDALEAMRLGIRQAKQIYSAMRQRMVVAENGRIVELEPDQVLPEEEPQPEASSAPPAKDRTPKEEPGS